MTKIRITTPENIEVEYLLAGLGSRTAAAVIDMLIQVLIDLIFIIIFVLIINLYPSFWSLYYGWIVGIGILLFSIINYGYFIFMELKMNGQTIGKKALKLRVIRNNGQPLTLKHSAIRNLFRILLDNYGIGPAFMFFSKQSKRLGDLLASTIVIAEQILPQPITLAEMVNLSNDIHTRLSPEEYEIIKEYVSRRFEMDDCEILKMELRKYFCNEGDEGTVNNFLKLFQ